MKAMTMVVAVAAVATLVSTAMADPEKAYQAGKALSGIPKVDDRGSQERASDWMKRKGAEWGGAKPKPAPSPSPNNKK